MNDVIGLTIYDYICIIILISLWIYTSLCLFIILINGCSMHVISIPMLDNGDGHVYQFYEYIPLCIFTNYFNKRVFYEF
jgi:hypothetical protein